MAEIQLAIAGEDAMPTAGYAYAATEALLEIPGISGN